MDSSNRSSPPPDLPQAVTASLAPSRSTSHDPWLVAQLLRLRHQNEELSRRVTQLLTQVAASDPQPQPARDGSMRELVARLNEQQDQIDQVEKALTKLSRTQFKANTLGEAQVEQVAAVLKALQQTNARHEAEQQGQRIARHEQDARARHEARTAVVMEMLPILDGLNAALESGERLLHRDEEAQPTADPGVWARFSRWLEGTPPVQGSPSRSPIRGRAGSMGWHWCRSATNSSWPMKRFTPLRKAVAALIPVYTLRSRRRRAMMWRRAPSSRCCARATSRANASCVLPRWWWHGTHRGGRVI